MIEISLRKEIESMLKINFNKTEDLLYEYRKVYPMGYTKFKSENINLIVKNIRLLDQYLKTNNEFKNKPLKIDLSMSNFDDYIYAISYMNYIYTFYIKDNEITLLFETILPEWYCTIVKWYKK